MAQSVALDSNGNVIVAGTSFSPDFPQTHALTQIPQQCDRGCGIFRAPFVAKLDPTGSSLVYATLLGAPSPSVNDQDLSTLPTAVAVDAAGNAYVTGTTNLPNFPVAKGATLTPLGGFDAFLIKLDPNGNVTYSTLFGTSIEDAGTAILLSPNGLVYIVRSTGLQSPSSLSSDQELFLTTLDAATGRALTAVDLGQGRTPQLTLGAAGQVNVAITRGCLGCAPQVVVQRVDTGASKILNASYSGPLGETLVGMTSGADGSFYLALDGATPTIKHLDPAGTLLLTTTVNQLKQGSLKAFALDRSGNFYLGGTAGPGLPQLHSSQPSPIYSSCPFYSPSGGFRGFFACASSGFITALNPTTAALNWSTYAGGYNSTVLALATDPQGNVYTAGQNLTLSGPNAGKPIAIVKFIQQIPAININPDALTDSASYYAGLPNPKGLATVFLSGLSGIEGTLAAQTIPLPAQLAGVSVRVDGVLAPLLAIANIGQGQQINFQVPSTLNLDTGSIVQISQGNNSIFLGGPRTPPGIFFLSDGTPAIQHAADYSLVTAANPVIPGETIVIYVTGLADPNSAPPDGIPFTQATPVSEVSVRIGEVGQQVLYAGGAPGLIGVDQINCKTSALASGQQSLSVGSRNPFSTGFQTISKPVTLFVK